MADISELFPWLTIAGVWVFAAWVVWWVVRAVSEMRDSLRHIERRLERIERQAGVDLPPESGR